MTLPTLKIFRTVGMLACAIMLGLGLASIMDLGLQQVQGDASSKNALAMLAMKLAGLFSAAAADRPSIGYTIFLSLFILCICLFAIAFWLRTSPTAKRPTSMAAGLLAAQLLIGVLVEPWTEPGLVYVFAMELAFVLPHRAALAWLCAQIVLIDVSAMPFLLGVVAGKQACNVAGAVPPPLAVVMGLSWIRGMIFQVLAFCIGYFANAEMRSRIALAGAYADLVATQLLLADAIRSSERERISRNLHDAIGHHLAALNLQLDLAMRQAGSRLIESVRTSRLLAQRLLAEVRAVVGVEREHQVLDLRLALETLCAGIPTPRIALSFDSELAFNSPTLAHTIFRSVQESISNAVRHSGANILDIVFSSLPDGLAISISDDGKGMHKNKAGNGLRGIRERIEEQGGKLEAGNRIEGGFNIKIWLPQC